MAVDFRSLRGVSGQQVEVSGQPVTVSGDYFYLESGAHVVAQVESGLHVQVSGQHVFVESGVHVVIPPVEISGAIVEISGQHVYVESGVCLASGLYPASGVGAVIQSGAGVVVQSGVGVLVSGQHLYVESGLNVVAESGLGVVPQSGIGVQIQSGAGVLISGQHVFAESGVHVIVESGLGVVPQSGIGVQVQSGYGVVLQSGLGGVSGQYVNIQSGQGVVVQSGHGVVLQSGLGGVSGQFVNALISGTVAIGSGIYLASGIYQASGVGVQINSGVGVTVQSGYGVILQSGLGGVSGLHVVVESGLGVQVESGAFIVIESGIGVTVASGVGVTVQSGYGIILQSGLGGVSGQYVNIQSGQGVVVQSGYGVVVNSGVGVTVQSGISVVPVIVSGSPTNIIDQFALKYTQTPTHSERWSFLHNLAERKQIFYSKYGGREIGQSVWRIEASGAPAASWSLPNFDIPAAPSGYWEPAPWNNAVHLWNSRGATSSDFYMGTLKTFRPPVFMRVDMYLPTAGAVASGAHIYAGFENNAEGGWSYGPALHFQQSTATFTINTMTPTGLNLTQGSSVLLSAYVAESGGWTSLLIDYDPPQSRLWQYCSGIGPDLVCTLDMRAQSGDIFATMQGFVANESVVMISGFYLSRWDMWEQEPKKVHVRTRSGDYVVVSGKVFLQSGTYLASGLNVVTSPTKNIVLFMSGGSVGHSGTVLAYGGVSGAAVTADIGCSNYTAMALTYQVTHMSNQALGTRCYLLASASSDYATAVDAENPTDAFTYIEPYFLSGKMTSSCKTVNIDILPPFVQIVVRNLGAVSAGPYRVFGHIIT